MNINAKTNGLMFASPLLAGSGLKSTQQRMERQMKCQNQVSFLQNKKEQLKDMECDSIEKIQKKLEMFHSYEDQIAAAKQEYNFEQMWHIMDEAREQGKKIAEKAEELEPKTAEERREDKIEEALGTDEEKGELTESMDEISDIMEEVSGNIAEELAKDTMEQITDQMKDFEDDLISKTLPDEISETVIQKATDYKRFDRYI